MGNARDVVVGQIDASQSPEAGERFGWQFGDEILLQAPINEKGEAVTIWPNLLSMWLNLQLGGIIRQCNGYTRQTLLTAIDDAIGTATRVGAAVLHAAFHWRMLGETCKCVCIPIVASVSKLHLELVTATHSPNPVLRHSALIWSTAVASSKQPHQQQLRNYECYCSAPRCSWRLLQLQLKLQLEPQLPLVINVYPHNSIAFCTQNESQTHARKVQP